MTETDLVEALVHVKKVYGIDGWDLNGKFEKGLQGDPNIKRLNFYEYVVQNFDTDHPFTLSLDLCYGPFQILVALLVVEFGTKNVVKMRWVW